VIRRAIRADLEELGYEICEEVGDTAAAIAAALEHRPGICLLDVEMPGGGGIAAAREIAAHLPATRIVMLTVSRDDRDVAASTAAGAVGFVLKDVTLERLHAALLAVLDGKIVVSPHLEPAGRRGQPSLISAWRSAMQLSAQRSASAVTRVASVATSASAGTASAAISIRT